MRRQSQTELIEKGRFSARQQSRSHNCNGRADDRSDCLCQWRKNYCL